VEDCHHKVPLEEQTEAFDGCSHELHMHDKLTCLTKSSSVQNSKLQPNYSSLILSTIIYTCTESCNY
jgi:hypothetical protein